MKSAPSNVPKNTSVTVSDLAPPRVARLSLRVFALGLVLLVIWAAFGQIDQVTRATGQVIVESRMQVIQSPDGGVLTELHVKEGDQVQNGQLLATFEKERTAAAVADSRAKVAALRTALARLHAEVYGTPLKFDEELKAYPEYIHNQTELYKKRQTAFHEDAAALERIIALTNAELQINQELEKSGDVSRTEVLRLQRSVADLKAQLLNKKNKYFQDAQTEMTKAQEDLNTQTETLRDRSQVLEHTTLNSPVDGVVNNIRVNTLGGGGAPRRNGDGGDAYRAWLDRGSEGDACRHCLCARWAGCAYQYRRLRCGDLWCVERESDLREFGCTDRGNEAGAGFLLPHSYFG